MKYHILFFRKLRKISQNVSSAAVVIAALRVNFVSCNSVSAYWITQKGLKAVFDYEDNLEKSSHDINCVRDIMMKHFNVSAEDILYRQFNPLYSGNPYMSTSANGENQDEMQHEAFHQRLHCLLLIKLKKIFRQKYNIFMKIVT